MKLLYANHEIHHQPSKDDKKTVKVAPRTVFEAHDDDVAHLTKAPKHGGHAPAREPTETEVQLYKLANGGYVDAPAAKAADPVDPPKTGGKTKQAVGEGAGGSDLVG